MPRARAKNDDASIAPVGRSGRVATRQAVDARLEVGRNEPLPANEEMAGTIDVPKCSICLDDLSTKRSLSFIPCGHSFHRTCATKWLYLQPSSNFTCSDCRQRVHQLQEGRRRETRSVAIGGLPTPWHNRTLLSGSRLTDRKLKEWAAVVTRNEVAHLRRQQEKAVRDEAPAEFVEDINKELASMKVRLEYFEDAQTDIAQPVYPAANS